MKPIICVERSTNQVSHSGAPPQGGEPGIHNPRPVVMGSGLVASRRPRTTAYDSNLKIAELVNRMASALFPGHWATYFFGRSATGLLARLLSRNGDRKP